MVLASFVEIVLKNVPCVGSLSKNEFCFSKVIPIVAGYAGGGLSTGGYGCRTPLAEKV